MVIYTPASQTVVKDGFPTNLLQTYFCKIQYKYLSNVKLL